MGYDGGYYMMGGMHGLWWLFWVVLLGVLVFSGARAGDWRNRSGQTLRDTLTSCCNVAWRGANSLPLSMKSVSRCLIGIHGPSWQNLVRSISIAACCWQQLPRPMA